MKKVMVFGTFDLLHEGHLHLFKEAKKYGDILFVVVARDSSVLKMKGILPHHNELERVAAVQKVPFVDHAILGHEDDFYKVIEEHHPAVLCFGYDQNKMNVEEEIKKRKIK
ncbi:MAG: adenylyltransferase/cytidyltransferase family protein, partial [Nanoarchaeota archaeon]